MPFPRSGINRAARCAAAAVKNEQLFGEWTRQTLLVVFAAAGGVVGVALLLLTQRWLSVPIAVLIALLAASFVAYGNLDAKFREATESLETLTNARPKLVLEGAHETTVTLTAENEQW